MVSQIANYWVEKNYEIAVVTIAGVDRDYYKLHPRVVRIGLGLDSVSNGYVAKFANTITRIRNLRATIRNLKPATIISFIDTTNALVIAAALGLGIPIVVSERIDPRRYKLPLLWEIARRVLYPMAHALVMQSESAARWGRRLTSATKVFVIPNFVRELPYPSCAARERLVLAVGRLQWQKGFDLLIRAFAASGLAKSEYRMVILGDGPERESLASLATSLGIQDFVCMPGLSATPEELMSRTSIFVLSSRFEGFPNVLLEAMAMGCPVIATDCDSGPRDIVRHLLDGILIEPDDVDALATAMKVLGEDSQLCESLAKNALEVRSRFSSDKIMSQWTKLVELVEHDH